VDAGKEKRRKKEDKGGSARSAEKKSSSAKKGKREVQRGNGGKYRAAERRERDLLLSHGKGKEKKEISSHMRGKGGGFSSLLCVEERGKSGKVVIAKARKEKRRKKLFPFHCHQEGGEKVA